MSWGSVSSEAQRSYRNQSSASLLSKKLQKGYNSSQITRTASTDISICFLLPFEDRLTCSDASRFLSRLEKSRLNIRSSPKIPNPPTTSLNNYRLHRLLTSNRKIPETEPARRAQIFALAQLSATLLLPELLLRYVEGRSVSYASSEKTL